MNNDKAESLRLAYFLLTSCIFLHATSIARILPLLPLQNILNAKCFYENKNEFFRFIDPTISLAFFHWQTACLF